MNIFNRRRQAIEDNNNENIKLKEEILKLRDMVANSNNDKTVSYLVGKSIIDIINGTESISNTTNNLKMAYTISLRNRLKERRDLKFIDKLAIPVLNLDLVTITDVNSSSRKNSVPLKGFSSSTGKELSQFHNEPNKKLKSTEIKVAKKDPSQLKNTFSQGLTLLDPISQECWEEAFRGYGIVKNSYSKQLDNTKSDFAFFESAWKANKGQWIYAFNSPNLQHDNAQKLLDVIARLRSKNIPIIFWNKEDPMHYEMFKPIAKEADFIFTTDSETVDKYKKDLSNNNVWSLPFAAPVKKTNPTGRFEVESESICFAGTYYAKNHPDRKKQMDMLLPSLLKNNGSIYDRASNDKSGNYEFPEQYRDIIRPGVEFDEMIKLYKAFKIFLNVNTITNSTTMMSRRVYELLASGTPVVSTPSKAITAQFPGIVLTGKNQDEVNIAVQHLLEDSYFWHRQSVLGIREVLSKHTYELRWEYIKERVTGHNFLNKNDKSGSVSIIANYTGLTSIEAFIETLYAQKGVTIDEIFIIDNSHKLNNSKRKKLIGNKYQELKLHFKSCSYIMNELKYINSSYLYFTDDSIINFSNAIYDLIQATKYNKAKAISRKIYYSFSELNKDTFKVEDLEIVKSDWYSYVNSSPMKSLIIIKESLEDFNLEISNGTVTGEENSIYTIDRFNIVRLEKLQNNKIYDNKCINNFIYRFNSRLGI